FRPCRLSSLLFLFPSYSYCHTRPLPSFPTRRSSDLDTLQFSKTVFSDVTALLAATHDDALGNAVMTDAAHDTITLQHVTTAQLRSEVHTSELQSPCNLVCRLLLEKQKLDAVPLRLVR